MDLSSIFGGSSDSSSTDTSGDSTSGVGSYIGDFASTALSGLGFGSGSQAAQTIGSALRPAPSAPSAPAPASSSLGAKIGLSKITPTEIALIAVAGIAAVYFLSR